MTSFSDAFDKVKALADSIEDETVKAEVLRALSDLEESIDEFKDCFFDLDKIRDRLSNLNY